MLTVTNITLFHFCQFESFSCNLHEGLTKLSGPNGSGKTNIFRGIVYGLTGWCDASWGSQSDMQKDDESVPGYVELVISEQEEVYTLKRFTGSGPKLVDTLSKGDVVVAKNRQKVNQWLEERFACPMSIVAQLMWLRQEQPAWLLTATAAQVNAFLGQIFNTKVLEDLRKHLKAAFDKVPKLSSEFQSRAAEAEAVIKNSTESVSLLETEIANNKERISELEKLQETLSKGMSRADKDMRLKHLTQEAERLTKEVGDLPAGTTILPVNEVEQKISTATANKSAAMLKQSSLQHQLESVEVQLRKLEAVAAVTTCELCGSHVSDPVAYMKAKSGFISPIPKEELLDMVAKLKVAISEKQKEIESCDSTIDHNKKCLAYLKLLDIETQLKHLSETPVIEVDVSAESLASDLTTHRKLLTEQEQTMLSLKAAILAAQQRIVDAEADKKAYIRNEKARTLLSTTRDVLSQSRAQARYINSKVSSLNANIAHYLQMSEMPFTAYLDTSEHIFKYRMQGSDQEHHAGMLSGAQKAAAAIAIQMALVTTAVPDLSLLLVDEADAALSQENKFIATRLYRTLSQAISNIGGSVIIISQDDSILGECEHLIETGG